MDINNITINAAFYEVYENVFNEDFFSILTKLLKNPRIVHLRNKKIDELTDAEKAELIEVSALTKKYTPRIAYIGNLLYKKQFNGSYQDYLSFLSSLETSELYEDSFVKAIWEKVIADQKLPNSVKNA
mgnify:CR=1 FL=1